MFPSPNRQTCAEDFEFFEFETGFDSCCEDRASTQTSVEDSLNREYKHESPIIKK